MQTGRRIELLSYIAFIALIFTLPFFMDEFGLNRFAKYLVFGMCGVAISLSWGYAGILKDRKSVV